MKKRRIAVAAAVLCLTLSGCTGLSLNGHDILAPPKAEGNHAEVQELIRSKVNGKKYEMICPESGEYQSSIIFRDIDSDGVEEAVAMYSDSFKAINVLIADNTDGSYRITAECAVPARKLSRLEFADFNGDGVSETLLSYPNASAGKQSLTVISLNNEAVQTDMPDTCAAHLIGDFNGDRTDDLLTLALSDGKELPTAVLYTDSGSGLVRQSACEIASDATEYFSLKFGKIDNELNGAVVDAKCAGGDYATQLICYDASVRGLINPLYVGAGYEKTKRTAAVSSADIDGDGIMEIPLCTPMEYSNNEEAATVCNRIDWSAYNYAQLTLTPKQSAILCDKLGFMLRLTPEHANIVTAFYTDKDTAAVYLSESKRTNPENAAKLLTIRRYDKNAYSESAAAEPVAGKSSAYVYTYVIEAGAENAAYTDDEVKNNFFIL